MYGNISCPKLNVSNMANFEDSVRFEGVVEFDDVQFGSNLYIRDIGVNGFTTGTVTADDVDKIALGRDVHSAIENAIENAFTTNTLDVTGDVIHKIGNSAIGYNTFHPNFATFAHKDQNTKETYAFGANSSGKTFINAASGQPVSI